MNQFSRQTFDAVEFAAELLKGARRAVVLTGAGISTPSGIPDFRSEGTGLWSQEQSLDVASQLTFRTHPEKFFEWFRPLVRQIYFAKPNLAHIALAELESMGFLRAILTQNIDLLHQKAGSKRIIQLHGTMSTLSCTQCYRQFDSEEYLLPFVENGRIPHCPECSAILKPDVILFGEQLPQKMLCEAQLEARTCDLIIVIGSSLEVLPVAGLPMQAIDRGAHLIIINNSPTYLNIRADIVLQEDTALIIPAIVERVINEKN